MKFFTVSLHALYKTFFAAFNSDPLEDARQELRATEGALLQAETIREDFNSKAQVYEARIQRLRGYISQREASQKATQASSIQRGLEPDSFPPLLERRITLSHVQAPTETVPEFGPEAHAVDFSLPAARCPNP